MQIYEINGPLTDNELNKTNYNFQTLWRMRNVLQSQINDLVLTEGDSPLEVRQARGGFSVLADRLNGMETGIDDANYKAENTQKKLDAIIANDGTSNNEVVSARVATDNTAQNSLATRLDYDFGRLTTGKLDFDHHYFNGLLACQLGTIHFSLKDKKVIINVGSGGVYVNGTIRSFLPGEYSFANITDQGFYVAYNWRVGELVFLNGAQLRELDKKTFGVFAFVRRDSERVWVQGSGYTVDVLENRSPFNGTLTSIKSAFVVDLINKRIETKVNGGFINVNGINLPLKDGVYEFPSTGSQSQYLAYDVSTRDIVFFDNAGIRNINYNRYGIFGNLRIDSNGYFIQGASYTVTNKISATKSVFRLSGDDFSRYKPRELYTSINRNIQATELYDYMDDTNPIYPNYVSKETIGESTIGVPIYAYHLKTPEVKVTQARKVKGLIIGNIHGHEKESTFGNLTFFKDLCESDQSSLNFIRANADITYIPALNPDGLNNDTRQNGNLVDLNRNFPSGWQPGDPEEWTYPGPEPASEVETNVLMEYVENLGEIDFAIDVHVLGAVDATESTGYLATLIGDLAESNSQFLQYYDVLVRQEFSDIPSIASSLGESRNTAAAGGMVRYLNSKNIRASVLEVPARATVDTGQTTQATTIKLSAHMLGNYILHLMREFNTN